MRVDVVLKLVVVKVVETAYMHFLECNICSAGNATIEWIDLSCWSGGGWFRLRWCSLILCKSSSLRGLDLFYLICRLVVELLGRIDREVKIHIYVHVCSGVVL